jgi:HK97 family phage major capsid protein
MDRDQIIAGVEFVRGVMQYHTDRIADGHPETDDERQAFNDGLEWCAARAAEVVELERRAAEMTRLEEFVSAHPRSLVPGDGNRHVPNVNTRTSDDPFDLNTLTVGASSADIRARAMSAIESIRGGDSNDLEAAARVLETTRSRAVAERYLLTGSDAYRSAFAKSITGSVVPLTVEEGQALSRAMTLTDAAGGYAVPFLIDPTIVTTISGTTNPFRAVSRVVNGTSDTWNGVNSGGVTAEWVAEGVEFGDNSPTLTQPSIPAHKAGSFVPFSFEIQEDFTGLEAELRVEMQLAKDDLEAAAFATGTGSGQPTGIVTALVASSPTVIVTSITTDVFAKADVYALRAALGARYRSRATWAADLAIFDSIRGFGSSDEAFTVDFTAGQIPSILGANLVEASEMDGVINAGAHNYVLVFGDFNNYVIYDRIGMSIEYVPHLFDPTNNRPNGMRGLLSHWRVGADSRNDNAFRLLNVT